jgi:hypothetical protein
MPTENKIKPRRNGAHGDFTEKSMSVFTRFLLFFVASRVFAPDALSVRSRKGRKLGCVEAFLAFLLCFFSVFALNRLAFRGHASLRSGCPYS